MEYARGTVIGEYMRRVQLYSPKGQLIREKSARTMEDAKAWAETQLDQIRNEVLGDGKRLADHPRLMADMFGTGKWGLRLHD